MFCDKTTQTKSDTLNKETQSDITVSEVKKEQLIVKPFVSKEKSLEKVLGLCLLFKQGHCCIGYFPPGIINKQKW